MAWGCSMKGITTWLRTWVACASHLAPRRDLALANFCCEARFRRNEQRRYSLSVPKCVRGSWGFYPLLILCLFLCGCRLRQAEATPSIDFIRIPPAADGGAEKIDIVEGRVKGGRPEQQQIVLYVKNGKWWVQPIGNEPFTRIRSNGTWTNATHLGTEYAALLVENGYRPAASLDELPPRGSGVAAVATVQGSDPAQRVSKTLQFAGYEWRLREAPSNRGGDNNYEASNAWTDQNGALHLRVSKKEQGWTCAEITLTRSFGYGTYSFVVGDTSHLEPPVVLAMFTYDYAGSQQNNREMDIEISRWGDLTGKNAQYVVQPYFIPENASRFAEPGGTLTHSMHWEPGRITFRTLRGGTPGKGSPVAEHVFTSGVPTPGVETIRLALYVFRINNGAVQHDNEAVIEKFEYLP
jgi:hypothetical protein